MRELLEKRGALSGIIIDETDGMPSSTTYRYRFNGLVRAYTLIGYAPNHDYEYLHINQELRRLHASVMTEIIDALTRIATVAADPDTDLLTINNEYTASVVLARCLTTAAGSLRWNIYLDAILRPDITVAARMSVTNTEILDYYLLPSADMTSPRIRLAPENGLRLDPYRFDSLDLFLSLAQRSTLQEAA